MDSQRAFLSANARQRRKVRAQDSARTQNLEAAIKEIREKQSAKDKGELPTAGRKPKLADYCKSYLEFFETVKNGDKRPRTIERERTSLIRWIDALGHVRLDKITKPMIAAFIDARLKAGLSARTVNLDVIALRNVLKKAANDGHLTALPMTGLKPLKVRTVKRPLLTPAQFEKLCAAARLCGKNGEELVDYLKFLAFTGARCSEALRIKWTDVDFERRQVTIGSDGLSKNGNSRVVDFNPDLETHLRDMWHVTRRILRGCFLVRNVAIKIALQNRCGIHSRSQESRLGLLGSAFTICATTFAVLPS